MNAYVKNGFKKEAEALATAQLQAWLEAEGEPRANKAFFVASEWGHTLKEDGSMEGILSGWGHRFFFEKNSVAAPLILTRWQKVDNNPHFEAEESHLENDWNAMEIR